MIIFSLESLADDSHRRHFIEPPEDHCSLCYDFLIHTDPNKDFNQRCSCGRFPGKWKLDWQAYYDACDKDRPILETIKIFNLILYHWEKQSSEIEIWSYQPENTREKVCKWISKHLLGESPSFYCDHLKMRPIGIKTPANELKEMWLHDTKILEGKEIDFIFDSDPQSIEMFRRYGIFAFDCNQNKE